jgi:hypothetical protein
MQAKVGKCKKLSAISSQQSAYKKFNTVFTGIKKASEISEAFVFVLSANSY